MTPDNYRDGRREGKGNGKCVRVKVHNSLLTMYNSILNAPSFDWGKKSIFDVSKNLKEKNEETMLTRYTIIILFVLVACSCSKVEEEPIHTYNLEFTEIARDQLEGSVGSIQIVSNQPLKNDLYLEVQSSGEAIEGEDYEFTGGHALVMKAGQSSVELSFKLITDNKVEGHELVTFTITNIESFDEFNYENTEFALTIIDNDEPANLQFQDSASYVTDTKQYTAKIELSFDRFIKSDVGIELSYTGTASEGTDYDVITPKQFTLVDGVKSIIVEIVVYPNDSNEINESIIIGAEVVSGIDAVTGEISTHELTILEDGSIEGIYKVIASAYYRIGEQPYTTNWNGEERLITKHSVNTFSYNGYWGRFEWEGGYFNFTIDPNTHEINVPITDVLFAGDYIITCTDNPEYFINVPCDESNIFVEDQVNGQHKIYLTYGYYFDTDDDDAGPREYYEVLERVIN